MSKLILGLLMLSGSFGVLAQTLEGAFPAVKEVQSSNDYKPNMGLTAGINNTRNVSDTTGETGVNVGFQPLIPFGLGFELSTSRFDTEDDQSYKRVTALGKATYNFGGDIPVLRDAYVGGAAGPVFLSGRTEFGAAPLVGFDIPLATKKRDYVSLGLNTRYLYVTDAPNSLITNAAVSYWF